MRWWFKKAGCFFIIGRCQITAECSGGRGHELKTGGRLLVLDGEDSTLTTATRMNVQTLKYRWLKIIFTSDT